METMLGRPERPRETCSLQRPIPRRTFLKTLGRTGGLLSLGGGLGLGGKTAGAADREIPTEKQLWATADERIEQHRKADATVVVLFGGRAVPAATVKIEQTCHRFLFGSNIFMWQEIDPHRPEDSGTLLQKAYRERFAELFNYATLGFYWWAYEPKPGQPRHVWTAKVARWCQEHHILTKGHPLAWNWEEPRWLPENPEEILRLQLGRIEDCVKRFAGLVDYWDVVNEAVDFNREECQRQAPRLTSVWAKLGRVEFTKQCLQQARAASAKAFLLVNDYQVSPRYEQLLEALRDAQDRPLFDAIGIQSHQHGGVWPISNIWDVCQRFSRFGVPLHFTETTILSGVPGWNRPAEQWTSTPEGEARQAEDVVRFYTMLFSHPAVQAITWWDLSDLGAWQGAPAGLIRKDMSPKPAYEALRTRIKGQWWTRTEEKTDQDGICRWRGFLGQYTIRVSGQGRQLQREVQLTPHGENRFVLELPAQ